MPTLDLQTVRPIGSGPARVSKSLAESRITARKFAVRLLACALAFASLAAQSAPFPAFSLNGSTYIPGATSSYTVTFTTVTNVAASQYIFYAGFPIGFTVAANCANSSVTVNSVPQPCTVGMSPAGAYSWLIGTGVVVAPGSNVVIVLNNVINAPTAGVKTIQWLRTANGSGAEIDTPATLPTITLNALPTATSLAVSGAAQFGQVLTGSYVYSDAEADPQDTSGTGSSYRFVRSSDANVATTGDNTDVAVGTTAGISQTYTAQAADIGTTLFYCVTPRASSGSSPGLEACSSGTAITTMSQAITVFTPTTPVVFGAAPATLTATGGPSGNPVVFATTSAASICTVSGTTLTYVGIGLCNLTADQAAGGNYSAAPQATASVTINAVTSIPTLSEWAMILLSSMLMLLGLGQLRRRGTNAPGQ